MEIKRQLDATDDFYCRSYCLRNMFRGHHYAHHQKLERIIHVEQAIRSAILLLAQHVSEHHYAHHQELESIIHVEQAIRPAIKIICCI